MHIWYDIIIINARLPEYRCGINLNISSKTATALLILAVHQIISF